MAYHLLLISCCLLPLITFAKGLIELDEERLHFPVMVAERYIDSKGARVPQSAFAFYSTLVGLAYLKANSSYSDQIIDESMWSLVEAEEQKEGCPLYSGAYKEIHEQSLLYSVPVLQKGQAEDFLPWLSNSILKTLFEYKSNLDHYYARFPNQAFPFSLESIAQYFGSDLAISSFNLSNESSSTSLYIWKHSFNLLIDEILGLRSIEEYNRELNEFAAEYEDLSGAWFALNPLYLYASYSDLFDMMRQLALPKGAIVADMGSGIGRLGFVIGSQFPDLQFIGYEILPTRINSSVKKAKKLKMWNIKFKQADFSAESFKPIETDVYFIFISNSKEMVMNRLMEKLRKVAEKRKIILIVRQSIGCSPNRANFEWLGPAKALPIKNFFMYESIIHLE